MLYGTMELDMPKMFQVIQSLEVFKINGQDTNNIYKRLGV